MKTEYSPEHADIDKIQVPAKFNPLINKMASREHDQWARRMLDNGWRHGPDNHEHKRHHGLVPFEELPDRDQEILRIAAKQKIQYLLYLGVDICERKEELSYNAPRLRVVG